jgi:hypothetical protein
MPVGLEVTVPDPVPTLFTVKGKVTTWVLKVAVTFVAADTVTVHVPVPLQGPLQPAKMLSLAGLAVSVTLVPDV